MHSPQKAPSPHPRRSYLWRILETSVAGAVVAAFLSVYALLVYAVAGTLHVRDGSEPALGTLVRTYFVACLAAGGVVGLLGPVFNAGRWGRLLVGGFAGAVAVPLLVLPLFKDPLAFVVVMAIIGAMRGAWMADDDTTLEQISAYRRWLRERGLKEPR